MSLIMWPSGMFLSISFAIRFDVILIILLIVFTFFLELSYTKFGDVVRDKRNILFLVF